MEIICSLLPDGNIIVCGKNSHRKVFFVYNPKKSEFSTTKVKDLGESAGPPPVGFLEKFKQKAVWLNRMLQNGKGGAIKRKINQKPDQKYQRKPMR